MIGETSFKGLCSHAKSGLPIRALYITRDAPARKQQHLDMLNVASARGLNTIWYEKERKLMVETATVYLRIAHPYIDRELREHEWHFIHGLEYLEELPNVDWEAISANLLMMARL